jgi:elongation factor G
MGLDSEAKNEVINAQVPMAEIQRYAADLTSFTGGRGSFEISFSHYEEVPPQITEKIVAKAQSEE